MDNTYEAPVEDLGKYRDQFEAHAQKLGPKFWPRAKKLAGFMLPAGHDRLFRTTHCEAEISRYTGGKFCNDLVAIRVCPVEVDESIDSASWPEVTFWFPKPQRWSDPAPEFHIWCVEGDPELALKLAEQFVTEFHELRQVSIADPEKFI